jgi:hypothetical protein
VSSAAGMQGLVPDGRDEILYALSLLLLVAGTAVAVAALRVMWLDVPAAALGAGGAAAWVLSNGEAEGAVLFEPLQGNGLTVADLLALPVVVLVAILCWRRVREAGR